MIRLTEQQIAEAWDKARLEERDAGRAYDGAFDFALYQNHLTRFAHRIAALAVQEVERGVDPTYKTAFLAEAKRVDRLHAEVATLTAQLAEVTKEREDLIAEASGLHTERNALRAQLAEVTKERDSARAERADLTSRNTALRAQLRVSKQEELDEICARAKAGDSKAFSTLCTRILEIVERKTAPPAPEKVNEVVVHVEDAYASEHSSPVVRITPADAKRIVRLAQEATNG